MSISGTIAAVITFYFTDDYYAAATAYSIAAGVESLVLAKGVNTRGPTLSDLQNQISTYGAVIPIVRGAFRIPGNIIFATDKEPVDTTIHSSGKGGGGMSATTTSYVSTFAIAFCEGPCFDFGRMWIDKKLAINFQNTADPATLLASANIAASIRFYPGTETQMPDPFIEAHEGVGNASAFRGTCYIVFERFPLTPYGNRIPVIEVELIADGSKGISHKTIFELDANDAGDNAVLPQMWSNGRTSYAWRPINSGAFVGHNGALVVFKSVDGNDATEYLRANFSDVSFPYLPASTTQTPWMHGLVVDGSGVQSLVLCAIDASDSYALNDAQDPDSPFNELFFELQVNGTSAYTEANGSNRLVAIDETAGAFSFVLRDGNPKYYGERITIFDGTSLPMEYVFRPVGLGSPSVICAMSQRNGRIFALKFDGSDGLMHLLQINANDATLISDWPGGAHSPASGTDIQETLRTDGSLSWAWFPADNAVGRWNSDGSYAELAGGVNLQTGGSLYNGIGGAGAYVDDSIVISASETATAGPGGTVAAQFWEFQLVHFNAITAVGLPLSDVVHDLCVAHGVTPIVTELTNDFVSGVVITKQMAPADALTFLAAIYHFDSQPAGASIYWKKRGAAPVMTIDVQDLAAHDFGANDADDAFPLDRAKELDIAQYVSVNYTDFDNEYQPGNVPAQRLNTESTQQLTLDATAVALTAAQAIKLAAVSRDLAVVERMKSSKWAGDYRLKALQDADVVLIKNGGLILRHRIRKVTDQAGLIQLESVADDAYVYNQAITAQSKNSSSQIVLAPATRLDFLDIPILQDADDDTGAYARVTPTSTAGMWPGADLANLENGVKVLGGATQPNAVGIALTALPDWTGVGFDESDTVDVQLSTPGATLSNTTGANVLAGQNAGLLGDEIIGYRMATLLSAAQRQYRLTGLLRRQRDTVSSGHVVGERFVPLSIAGTIRFDEGVVAIGVSHKYGAITLGRGVDTAARKTFTNRAIGKRPFAPVQLGAGRLGNADVVLNWVRQTRLAAPLRPGVAAPLGEASELYDIELANDSSFATVIRTLSSIGAPPFTYAAAARESDVTTLGLAGNFYCRVFQLSEVFGRGRASAPQLVYGGAAFSLTNPLVAGPAPAAIVAADGVSYDLAAVYSQNQLCAASKAANSGVRYFEFAFSVPTAVTTLDYSPYFVGVGQYAGATVASGDAYIHSKLLAIFYNAVDFYNDATKASGGLFSPVPTTTSVLGVVVNLAAGTLKFYLNGTFAATAPTSFVSGAYYTPLLGGEYDPITGFTTPLYHGHVFLGDEGFKYFGQAAAENVGLVAWNNGL